MLILLDIDGVMVPAYNWKAPEILNDGFPDFSKKAVRGLNKIIAETNAAILLTTSHKSLYSIESWKEIFSKRGIEATIFKLEDAGELQNRRNEIESWFQAHQDEQNFVILDDDKSLNALPSTLKNKLILISSLIGLNEESADRAIETLRNTSLMQA